MTASIMLALFFFFNKPGLGLFVKCIVPEEWTLAWRVLFFGPVKAALKTVTKEPLFEQGPWMTPWLLAFGGIAAALSLLALA